MSSIVISERHTVSVPRTRFAPFPASRRAPSPIVRSSVSSKTVHCFIDYSNLFINARKVTAEWSDRILPDRNLEIDFGNLAAFARRNRNWGTGFAAAGLDRGEAIQKASRRAGIEFRVFERGKHSNREQGVDEIIQGRMYKLAAQNPDGQVALLITGDGNGCARDEGFLDALKTLRKKGFEVEVASWKHCFNRTLRHWTEQHGKAWDLDRFFNGLTSEPGRPALRLASFSRMLLELI